MQYIYSIQNCSTILVCPAACGQASDVLLQAL